MEMIFTVPKMPSAGGNDADCLRDETSSVCFYSGINALINIKFIYFY